MSGPVSTDLTQLRQQLRDYTHADEERCVSELLARSVTTKEKRAQGQQRAYRWVERCRQQGSKHNLLDAFLGEFSLSNPEGIALMCLAEALLRIPDSDTADALIDEKIGSGKWTDHFQQSDSSLVNAATLGLIVTGGFTSLDANFTANPLSWLEGLGKRLGEPVVRQAIRQAMGLMGKQYVLGRTIDEAANTGTKSNAEGTRFSFDMLGEGARTHITAEHYFDAYLTAINAIGARANTQSVIDNDGISVKLSALHPRYHYSHKQLLFKEMMPQLKALALAAKGFQIGFNIDAEESERLDISLDLFEELVRDPELADWDGLGIVVQAYQKRAPYLLAWLESLARDAGRRFMVRLVKGAYWDREIKFAQEMAYDEYPVYTRKENTDLSYRVCAEQLFSASDVLYPQFATHNAMTIAAVLESAEGCENPYEFQRLHGMGELLYQEVLSEDVLANLPLRVYAPVGAHKDLLPYLVRRLLENGANSSFVNQFLDKDTPIEEIIEDPIELAENNDPKRHHRIPLPGDIFRFGQPSEMARDNSQGLDLDNPDTVSLLLSTIANQANKKLKVGPLVNGYLCTNGQQQNLGNPADPADELGVCYMTDASHIDEALDSARGAYAEWDAAGGKRRAKLLSKAGDLLEQHSIELIGLIGREAGRTLDDAISEVREAVDFCRYYGLQAARQFDQPTELPGPTGELNQLSLHGRGTFLCISPWNFPLAIFIGQISAALAAGNCVIAKPAEQTPAVAYRAVQLLHQAGIPSSALQLLMGEGSVIGPKLVSDSRVNGVCFTGSTAVAKLISRQLAERDGEIVPLIAETGGQNAMIVDSSALPEQVVDDSIGSAFTSAGQRCSALRILYLQQEIADDVIDMLVGAIAAMHIGLPQLLETDVGPVIDAEAANSLEAHIQNMRDHPKAKVLAQFDISHIPVKGTYVAPTLIELESADVLNQEVFGPILHVVRYQTSKLGEVLEQINQSGYGLTLGVHSRREGFAEMIYNNTRVGNTYINRNVIGAVVGVQPFGGQGLSGTGPKAGGPHYMLRFATEKTKSVNTVATGGNVSLLNLG